MAGGGNRGRMLFKDFKKEGGKILHAASAGRPSRREKGAAHGQRAGSLVIEVVYPDPASRYAGRARLISFISGGGGVSNPTREMGEGEK